MVIGIEGGGGALIEVEDLPAVDNAAPPTLLLLAVDTREP